MEVPGNFYMLTTFFLLCRWEQIQAAEAEFDLEVICILTSVTTLIYAF